MEDEEEELEEAEEDEVGSQEEETTAGVTRRNASGGSTRHVGQSTPLWQRVFMTLVVLAVASIVGQYKLESAPIGYCDIGKQTNAVLKAREAERREIENCHTQYAGSSDPDACPPLPLIPLPRPESCTPCPAHATCTRFDVMCDDGYIKIPHPFALVPYLPEIANGLPALGPIAFPPRCVVDPMRRRNIGQLGKSIDVELAKTRGRRRCDGVTGKDRSSVDAVKWGVELDELKMILKNDTQTSDKKSKDVSTPYVRTLSPSVSKPYADNRQRQESADREL